jgi:hypothetical protein
MIKPIRDEQSYTEALTCIEALWGEADNTSEGDELDIWLRPKWKSMSENITQCLRLSRTVRFCLAWIVCN